MSAFELSRGAAITVLAPGWALRAPGIVGHGEFTLAAPGVRRAAAAASLGHLDDVLAALDMTERATATFSIEPASPVVQARRSGEVGAVEAVELDVPPPPAGYEQVVLQANEDGTVTWHVAYVAVQAGGRRGAGALRRYQLPLHAGGGRTGAARPGAAPQRRGLFSTVARRVVKVLVFPVTDAVLGTLGHGLARAWEAAHVPYLVRTFDAANFQQAGAGALTALDWTRLAAGPALLFVHGTFSTSHGCFNRLSPTTLDALAQRYGGRTFALDHWTLSHDPEQNVRWFVEQIPPGLALDIDIICHSRGGLVSRVLAHGLNDAAGAAPRVRVGRIAFVAAPNDGTLLAHPDHVVSMIDRFTNVVQFLPDGPVEVTLELVITAVKALAHAGLTHLPGLAAQTPDGAFLQWLRSQPQRATRYFAIAADWEPNADSPLEELVKETVANEVVDRVFEAAQNDLVVPTAGVAGANGPGFPIAAADVFTFPANAGEIHTNLFGHEETSRHLLGWLDARPPLA